MTFVRVEDGKIVSGPGLCPKVWASISGFDNLSWQEQAQHGWFRFEADEAKPFDPRTEKAVWKVEFGPVVRSVCLIEPLTEFEIAANLEEFRQQKLARNAELRWQREVGGVEFYGIPEREVPIPIHTDRNSQQAIFMAAIRGHDATWKCANNEWHRISAQEMALLSESVSAHVEIAFQNEAAIAIAIMAAETFEELDQIDLEALWTASISE